MFFMHFFQTSLNNNVQHVALINRIHFIIHICLSNLGPFRSLSDLCLIILIVLQVKVCLSSVDCWAKPIVFLFSFLKASCFLMTLFNSRANQPIQIWSQSLLKFTHQSSCEFLGKCIYYLFRSISNPPSPAMRAAGRVTTTFKIIQ